LPAPFPLAIQKKNNLSEKCEAAFAEVAESKRAEAQTLQEKPRSAVVEKPRIPENFSEKKPALKNNFPASAPKIPPKIEQPSVPVRSSVAPVAVEKKNATSVPAPLPLDKAVAVVPAALKDYLAERFQVRFSRVIPASTTHVFSAEGELFVEKNDAPASEDSGETDDVSED